MILPRGDWDDMLLSLLLHRKARMSKRTEGVWIQMSFCPPPGTNEGPIVGPEVLQHPSLLGCAQLQMMAGHIVVGENHIVIRGRAHPDPRQTKAFSQIGIRS